MKVTGTGSTGTGPTRRTEKGRRADGDFASHIQGAPKGADTGTAPPLDAPPLDAPMALAGVEGLLAMQSVDPDAGGQGRKRMVQRAEDILDGLEEVRKGLLLGSIPKEKLTALAKLVRARRDTAGDPRLAAVLDEIELRAEVELAKLMRR